MNVQEIKQYLRNNKISYEELSRRSGITVNTLKSIFCGRTKNPRVDTMQKIENALNIQENSILTDLFPVLTDEERELLDLYRNILPEVRQGVLTMLRGMNGNRTNKYKEVK